MANGLHPVRLRHEPEDALRFLELAREMVLAGPEKVTAENALKDDEESRDAFWAQSLKTGLASFESRSKSSHNPRDPQVRRLRVRQNDRMCAISLSNPSRTLPEFRCGSVPLP